MGDCIDNNHMHQKDIRNIKPKSTILNAKVPTLITCKTKIANQIIFLMIKIKCH